ncbi:hypothetical protein LXEBMM8_EKPBGFGD_01366 [Lactiplantibacillus xiangfangensis]
MKKLGFGLLIILVYTTISIATLGISSLFLINVYTQIITLKIDSFTSFLISFGLFSLTIFYFLSFLRDNYKSLKSLYPDEKIVLIFDNFRSPISSLSLHITFATTFAAFIFGKKIFGNYTLPSLSEIVIAWTAFIIILSLIQIYCPNHNN